jgi:hypothetical protein
MQRVRYVGALRPRGAGKGAAILVGISARSRTGKDVLLRTLDVRQIRREHLGKR